MRLADENKLVTFNTIDTIVGTWDLSVEERNNKRDIIIGWREALKDEDRFNELLKICASFCYYSEKLTAESYKEIFERFITTCTDYDGFIKSCKFMPLRRKERMESSVDMFSSFRLVTKLDANLTNVNGPISFLNYYENIASLLKNKTEKQELLNKESEKGIIIMESQLQLIVDNKVCSKIKKQIKKLKDQNKKQNEILKQDIERFNDEYYRIKNIVLIDDFIGTGKSVVKLLRKILEQIKKFDIKVHLWVIETSQSGKREIEKFSKTNKLNIEILYYKISIDTLKENSIFSGSNLQNVIQNVKQINQQFNLKVNNQYCKNHAIATYVNAPNNNLTLLSEESNKWNPIFLRTKRIKQEIQKASTEDIKDIMKFLKEHR